MVVQKVSLKTRQVGKRIGINLITNISYIHVVVSQTDNIIEYFDSVKTAGFDLEIHFSIQGSFSENLT
jgi:hypothetical protein